MPQTARRPEDTPRADDDRRETTLVERAATLEEAKRAFLRTASHELRTPLNAIIGFSEIIAGELYGPLGAPQYRQYAEHVRESGYRLLKLVNQVLEVARLQGQAVDIVPRPVALDHAFDDVRDQLKGDLAERQATLAVADDGALPSVFADPKGLRTLLANLVQNAALYGPIGGVIEISAIPRGETVEIAIRDRGDGVDPTEIPRMMNPFEQGDNALSRSTQGAGLGLPIAVLLAEAMSGRLWLEPAEGGGLRACVVLPAA